MAGQSSILSDFSREVIIKNTFLEYAPTNESPLRRIWSAPAILQLPLDGDVQMPASGKQRRIWSAPAIMQLPLDGDAQMPASGKQRIGGRFEIQKEHADSNASKLPSKAGLKEELLLAPCMQMPASGNLEAGAYDGVKMPGKAELKEEQHRLGLCRPCSYFTFKEDGCQKGDDCEFCHMCSNEGARERRREIKKQAGSATDLPRKNRDFRNKKR